jgi:hypothetical protein
VAQTTEDALTEQLNMVTHGLRSCFVVVRGDGVHDLAMLMRASSQPLEVSLGVDGEVGDPVAVLHGQIAQQLVGAGRTDNLVVDIVRARPGRAVVVGDGLLQAGLRLL